MDQVVLKVRRLMLHKIRFVTLDLKDFYFNLYLSFSYFLMLVISEMQATDKAGAVKDMEATVTDKDTAEDMVIIIANISAGLEEEEVATHLVTIMPIITGMANLITVRQRNTNNI